MKRRVPLVASASAQKPYSAPNTNPRPGTAKPLLGGGRRVNG
jgi:hypothetical protein